MSAAPDSFVIFECQNCGTRAPLACIDDHCCNRDERAALIEIARLRDAASAKPIAVASIDGKTEFMRSDSSTCTCCDGQHIFASFVKVEGVTDYWDRPIDRIGAWIDNFATQKVDGRPIYEGKRVRITVEIFDTSDSA